ncbi:hypothetical protein QR680_011500 [Steinernema hermaphroditum]|uniref:Peptidase S1 domain-containing protein n=1 Tax=Steinernema hermaphroditum TaxID=289476 RepID=A0AA39I152_9BILA|nr:hypothetical protein QR680_011500 [Steinernema hermaphroditum]
MRFLVVFLTLLGLCLAAPSAPKHATSELILEGHQAYQGNFPYYVRVPACGGSLITPKHVLTAAHCVDQSTVGEVVVMGLDKRSDYEVYSDGTARANKEGVQIRKIVSVKTHTGFNRNDWHDDIAVLEIDQAFNLTNNAQLITIKADDSQLQRQYWTAVVGFGAVAVRGNKFDYPEDLQYAYIPLVPYKQCFKRWGLWKLWEKQLCAGSDKVGTGPGDSGGPMAAFSEGKYVQIGLVSYGTSSSKQIEDQGENPTVYTRTASYCDWITEKTNGAFHCV